MILESGDLHFFRIEEQNCIQKRPPKSDQILVNVKTGKIADVIISLRRSENLWVADAYLLTNSAISKLASFIMT